MRYLFLICLGFVTGCVGFLYLLSGSNVLIVAAVILIPGFVCLFLRKKRIFCALACLLISCAVGLGYCTAYKQFYLLPMQNAAEEEQVYCAEICRTPEHLSSGWYRIEVRVKLAGYWTHAVLYSRQMDDYVIGERLQFTGKLEWADTSQGENLYYPANGIRLTGSLPEDHERLPAEGFRLRNLPLLFCNRVQQWIQTGFSGEIAGLLTALLTGERRLLSAELRERLSITGIYHMVSVSGMHVSILIGIVQILCRKKRTLTALIGIPALVFFTLMTGAAPGTVRAALMLSILLLAPLLKRENDPPTTLAFSAVCILLSNPYELASVSFQLTFSATAGILLLSQRFTQAFVAWLPHTKKRLLVMLQNLYRSVASVIAVTLSAQLATLLINMWYFGQVCVISPITNLLTSFAVTLIFAIGLVAVVMEAIFPPLGIPFSALSTVLSRWVLGTVRLLSRAPFANMYTVSPYTIVFVIFLYVVVILLATSKEKKRFAVPAGCIGIMLCVCIILGSLQLRIPAFSFVMLDVGQGQCLLAESDGETLMIDCGGDSDAIAVRRAMAQLSTMGINQLNTLVLTHYDIDHAGGAALLMELVQIDVIYAPDTWDDSGIREKIQKTAEKTGTQFIPIRAQNVEITLGGGCATVFPPVAYTTDNETCLAVLCSFEQYDILVTGDMSADSEQLLLRLFDLPDLEILVAGHHGSKYSTSETLLAELRPETVLISVGENDYGHPAQETLTRIADSGAEVKRTDQDGSIVIRR